MDDPPWMKRQFLNWRWRTGNERRMADPTSWELPHRQRVTMEQALDARSQHEWFAVAEFDAAPSPSP
jgi:hypothetical protein